MTVPIQASLFERYVERGSALRFDLDNVGAKNFATHNFHPYPAKFIPQIPGSILDVYATRPSTVLDPFCGSGTVAVEAARRGHYCIANDLNPIATLITKAKTVTLHSADRVNLERLLLDLASSSGHVAPLVPDFKNRELWFSDEMLEELALIKSRVVRLPTESPALTLALCAFSAIIVKCSNQESETHWRSVSKALPRGFATKAFTNKLRDMFERSIVFSRSCSGSVDVHNESALRLRAVPDRSVDLIVTSPPYANSHDYYLYNKLRMFWLDYNHYAVQSSEIGSRHRHSDLHEPLETYLEEMRTSLLECKRVLRKDGALALVIGDSIFNAQLIDMGKCYTKLASDVGFELTYYFSFDQRRYTTGFQRGLKTMPKRSHIMVFV